TMVNPSSNDNVIDNPLEREGPVPVLLRLTANAAFLRSTDGRFYAQVSVGGRPEIYALRSAAFRDWQIDGYFRACGELPSDWSIRRVLAKLEATARFEGGTPSIFVRVGHDGDRNGNGSACYLDLADPGGQAVQIGPEGWSVVNNPRVHFHRPAGHLPLPMPSRDGSIDLLRPYVNLTDRDFRLLILWMAAALRPAGPYPILALYGQNGSAKSTLAKIVRRLIDPQAHPILAEPRNTRELMVSAVNGWLLVYDNISVIPRWLSDGLCLLATGGALAGYASFTNGERTVIHAQRPVILNGIEEFVRRGDLSDRALFLDLPPILPSRRRCEDEFWEAFHQDYPRILGGLLDAVAGGLRELPSVRLTELPRMADFAKFAEAVGRKLGWPAGTALSDYNNNRIDATMTQLEDSPVAAVLLDLGPDYLNDWSGSPTELLYELTAIAGKHADSPRWPKQPAWLTIELRRIAPQLAIHGIFAHSTRRNQGRVWSLTRDRKATETNGEMRNLMADEHFGLEPETTDEDRQL
ncbi:MAG: hypothetical protein ACHRXM_39135, partial [Isosphaerales bacterium]